MKILIFKILFIFSSSAQMCLVDTLTVSKSTHVIKLFKEFNFHLDSIRICKSVPNITGGNFPEDIKNASYNHKKTIFIGYTLTSILIANQKISTERSRLLNLTGNSKLSFKDSIYLDSVKSKYYAKNIDELLLKVDILPPSLVIAQGIDESGWGSSYFSLYGNSIFGMKAPKSSTAPYIIHPKTHFKSYKFNSLSEGIDDYILNINRHPAYKVLREHRAKARSKNEVISGYKLANGLVKYSTRGHAYVRTIQKFINSYNLQDFDDAFLNAEKPTVLVFKK